MKTIAGVLSSTRSTSPRQSVCVVGSHQDHHHPVVASSRRPDECTATHPLQRRARSSTRARAHTCAAHTTSAPRQSVATTGSSSVVSEQPRRGTVNVTVNGRALEHAAHAAPRHALVWPLAACPASPWHHPLGRHVKTARAASAPRRSASPRRSSDSTLPSRGRPPPRGSSRTRRRSRAPDDTTTTTPYRAARRGAVRRGGGGRREPPRARASSSSSSSPPCCRARRRPIDRAPRRHVRGTATDRSIDRQSTTPSRTNVRCCLFYLPGRAA